jgi:hypothetical protein
MHRNNGPAHAGPFRGAPIAGKGLVGGEGLEALVTLFLIYQLLKRSVVPTVMPPIVPALVPRLLPITSFGFFFFPHALAATATQQ